MSTNNKTSNDKKNNTTKSEPTRKPLPQSNIASTRKEIFDLSRKERKSSN